MIKYLGSKRRLLGAITTCVNALPGTERVLDLFSGTSRVGHALKQEGLRVVANDHNAYAHVFARCYVQADKERVEAPTRVALEALAAAPPHRGYFTRTFCEDARYVHPRNGMRVDGMRRALREMCLAPDVEAVVLTSLVEATDRVDSTTGVQMAYLKRWARRAENEIELRMPDVVAGRGVALRMDALEAAATVETDVAYLDPPYNQHSYLSNYHVWETLVRDDRPDTYGIANKRVDCRVRKSDFNSKVRIAKSLERVLSVLRARHIVVSFNDEGYITPDDMRALLERYGEVEVFGFEQARYVGAKIGIHDPQGRRVGRVGRLKNRELLFVVSREPAALDAVRVAFEGDASREGYLPFAK